MKQTRTSLPEPNPLIIDALHGLTNPEGFIELPDFIQTALYHSEHGYYVRNQQRVGRDSKSDFYTSVSLRSAFAEIVTEAAIALVEQAGLTPQETSWVEIGAEPGSTLLENGSPGFNSIETIGISDRLSIPPKAVVFSNELFDAQTFRQVRFDGQRWVEFGVRLDGDNPTWCQRSELSEEVAETSRHLPSIAPTGYTVDIPTGSRKLAHTLLSENWQGVFIAFDYGKTWLQLVSDTPQGTARAYFRHQQCSNILEAPGSIDITHHICWDHLEEELTANGFESNSLQSQESFIVHRAPKFLEAAFDPRHSALSPIRQKLKELMHPSFLGQKFQALSAIRKVQS